MYIFLFTAFLFSCSQEGKQFSSDHNMIVKFNHLVTFDYNSKILELKFNDEEAIKDTINLSKKDLTIIENSFFEKGVGNIKGEVKLGQFETFPPSEILIDIIQDNKVRSSLHWESDYKKGRTNAEQRIIEFCVIVVEVISNQKEFSKMQDISLHKQYEKLKYLLDIPLPFLPDFLKLFFYLGITYPILQLFT